MILWSASALRTSVRATSEARAKRQYMYFCTSKASKQSTDVVTEERGVTASKASTGKARKNLYQLSE